MSLGRSDKVVADISELRHRFDVLAARYEELFGLIARLNHRVGELEPKIGSLGLAREHRLQQSIDDRREPGSGLPLFDIS